MTAEYTIAADKRKATIRVTMGGFFGTGDVHAFARDLSVTLADMNTKPNEHLMLCDLRQMKIQAQETVAAFRCLVGSAAFQSRRLAVVTGKSLVRTQAMRLTDHRRVSFFDDIDRAECWLLERQSARDTSTNRSADCSIALGSGQRVDSLESSVNSL
jgi:hypothetical protein